MLTTAIRPLTLTFRSTLEHAALQAIRESFRLADKDATGSLHCGEVASAMQALDRTEKAARSTAVVLAEVERAMKKHDTEGKKRLDFQGFLGMVCDSSSSSLRIPLHSAKLSPPSLRHSFLSAQKESLLFSHSCQPPPCCQITLRLA